MKRVISIFIVLFIIMFLSLYFSRYYYNIYDNKNVLTEEAIKKFEKDVSEGKEINMNNYIIKDKNYNNKVCLIGLKISNIIDSCFNKLLKYLVKHIDYVD